MYDPDEHPILEKVATIILFIMVLWPVWLLIYLSIKGNI